MTGYADQRERASGLDALIHDVLTKPFSLETLRSAVEAALASRAGEAKGTEHQPSSARRSSR